MLEYGIMLALGMFLGVFSHIHYLKFKIWWHKWRKAKHKFDLIREKLKRQPRYQRPPSQLVQIGAIQFELTSEEVMGDYERNAFGSPITHAKRFERMSPRDAVLLRDGQDVKMIGDKIVTGRWVCPYTAKELYSPAEIDIDHIVALGEAWRSGAQGWSAKKREAFARDPENLIVTSKAANRAKSDKDIAHWRPKLNVDKFIVSFLSTKAKYGLSIDQAEYDLVRDLF